MDILNQRWTFTLEQLEQYSLFLKEPDGTDGFLCQCPHLESFGKNCEYQLPFGQTFEETLQWQLDIRDDNQEKVQIYGDVVCYETLVCNSGVLCLDWRDICDGVQQCLEGKDEENCDLLEMNQCDEEEENRCSNGMCIPHEFFLDGELGCLDWSNEMRYKKDESCPKERVNTKCDDRLCPPNSWSCGDGECIPDRLAFQKLTHDPTCQSGRDQYFFCETHVNKRQWTMSNGRCFEDGQYGASPVVNGSQEEECEYFLKCALSRGGEIGCSCDRAPECAAKLNKVFRFSVIAYPRRAMVVPFLFFLFDSTKRNWKSKLADSLLITGTVRCGDSFGTVTKVVSLKSEMDLNARRMAEEHFCRPFRNNLSSENIVQSGFGHRCDQVHQSIACCNKWNPCLSLTRLNNGEKNCLNGRDEVERTEMEIEKTCTLVRRHRFRCSREQATCLSVIRLGDSDVDCRNRFDQWWLGDGRELSSVNCNDQKTDECSLLRQSIEQSWTSIVINRTEMQSEDRISFRSYCDTFWDLQSGEDENLLECEQWWICPEGRRRCGNGQCSQQLWSNDGQWDCADASDEIPSLRRITVAVLRAASRHDFTNQSYFVPSSCSNQSRPFLCLSVNATSRGFSCFNLSQIGDGQIDCLGGQDERNTLSHCSHSSSLGADFLCRSTKTCIPYYHHCFADHRCPNRSDDQPSMMAVWKYPISFDHLPVYRFGKVLHFSSSVDHLNLCSSSPCHPNEQYHQLMNNKSLFLCLCKTNLTGEKCSHVDEHCLEGYCSQGSLCQPNSRSSLQRDSLPFCLCPPNHYGSRCSIEHDVCLFNPCRNNGSCLPDSQLDRAICLCTRQFRGSHCQWRRPSIHFSLSSNNHPHDGVVIQYLQITLISLDFILVDQQVFKRFPQLIEYFQYEDQSRIVPDLVLAEIYSSHQNLSQADLYLLSVYRGLDLFALHGKNRSLPEQPLRTCAHICQQ